MLKSFAAALVFFTRLPFWRLKAFNVAPEYYKDAINYWAIVGWLTASVMAGTLWLSAQVLPYTVAIILAMLSRILITGALHEDGLADFFDGLGGGRTKERILEIMKDSHIGTYGVVSLIFYFLLFYTLLSTLPLNLACFSIMAADPLSKLISSQMTRFLVYARTEETSKAKNVYKAMSFSTLLASLIFGLVPLVFLPKPYYWLAILAPIIVFTFIILLLRKKIGGYTGDCCGAMYLLCELAFLLAISGIYNCLSL